MCAPSFRGCNQLTSWRREVNISVGGPDRRHTETEEALADVGELEDASARCAINEVCDDDIKGPAFSGGKQRLKPHAVNAVYGARERVVDDVLLLNL
jgi:hypothetical protein